MLFNNYAAANKVFDLSEYYREATEEEIQAFKSNEMFSVSNEEVFTKNVRGITVRKKIARILDMGTKIPPKSVILYNTHKYDGL